MAAKIVASWTFTRHNTDGTTTSVYVQVRRNGRKVQAFAAPSGSTNWTTGLVGTLATGTYLTRNYFRRPRYCVITPDKSLDWETTQRAAMTRLGNEAIRIELARHDAFTGQIAI